MASLPIDPRTGIPIVPGVPAGWSIGPDGTPIPAAGQGTTSSLFPSDLPLASMAVVGLAGYLLGKPRGEAKLWAAVGAGLGYYFKPIG